MEEHRPVILITTSKFAIDYRRSIFVSSILFYFAFIPYILLCYLIFKIGMDEFILGKKNGCVGYRTR